MKKIGIFLSVSLISTVAYAVQLSTVFNPFTGKPDYINVATGGGGGGGSSSGTVNSSDQFNVPYYSVAGSSNVLSGSSNFTWNNSIQQLAITGTAFQGPIQTISPNSGGYAQGPIFSTNDDSELVTIFSNGAGGSFQICIPGTSDDIACGTTGLFGDSIFNSGTGNFQINNSVKFAGAPGSGTEFLGTGVITVDPLTASRFIKTDASKNLVSYDLLNTTQTWTGINTYNSNTVFKSSITVTASSANIYEATFSTITTSFHVAVSTIGDIITNSSNTTMGTCGTSPSVIGDNNEGVITVGGGVVTSCTLNFAMGGWGTGCTVVCTESDNSTTVTGDVSAINPASVTFSFSATLGGGLIYYQCRGFGSACR